MPTCFSAWLMSGHNSILIAPASIGDDFKAKLEAKLKAAVEARN
jgi:hypothetical protein